MWPLRAVTQPRVVRAGRKCATLKPCSLARSITIWVNFFSLSGLGLPPFFPAELAVGNMAPPGAGRMAVGVGFILFVTSLADASMMKKYHRSAAPKDVGPVHDRL